MANLASYYPNTYASLCPLSNQISPFTTPSSVCVCVSQFKVLKHCFYSLFCHVLLSEEMKEDQLQQLQYTFYGYLSAFVASIYRHRPGVLTNMTVSEALAAKTGSQSFAGCAVIICVLLEMFDLIDSVCCLCLGRPTYYFGAGGILVAGHLAGVFMAGKGPTKNMGRYVQKWAYQGGPT